MTSDNKLAFPSKFENESKTVKLMLKMKKPIHDTGKIILMDSGFCVSAGILALYDKGMYGQALIKKRGRYWPRGTSTTISSPNLSVNLIIISSRSMARSFSFIATRRRSMCAKLQALMVGWCRLIWRIGARNRMASGPVSNAQSLWQITTNLNTGWMTSTIEGMLPLVCRILPILI